LISDTFSEKFDIITNEDTILQNNDDLETENKEKLNQQNNAVKDLIDNHEKEIAKNNFMNKITEKKANTKENHDLEQKILKFLNDLKIPTKENLHNRIVKAVLEKGKNAINDFSAKISLNKLSSLKIKIKNGLTSIETFKDDIPSEDYELLNQKLNKSEIIKNFFSSSKKGKLIVLDKSKLFDDLKKSIKKYCLREKINFERFNSLEGFKNSYEEIIKDINNLNDDLKFADALFTLMIYLIKRQQNLKYFMKELKYHIEEKHQIVLSLKEFVYNLLLNCEDEVKTKIFQLLHTTNPVPFLNNFLTSESIELDFHYETYWITENSINVKINSFSIDPKCKGKTRLLNKIFNTNFEETIEDSIFFNSTMDLQIIPNFGSINYNYCLVDTHGVADIKTLDKISNNFDAFIIHLNEDSLTKENVDFIFEFVSKAKFHKIFIFVRDCKKYSKRKDCTNQEMNREFLVNFSSIANEKVKLCRIPNFEKSNEIEDFSRDLRDFIYREMLKMDEVNINKNFLKIFSKKEIEKIKNIRSDASLLIEKLENAIKNDGIKQQGYFSIYPFYFEINLFQNELTKLVYFASNSVRCNDLKIKLTMLKNEMQDYIKITRIYINFKLFNQASKSCISKTVK